MPRKSTALPSRIHTVRRLEDDDDRPSTVSLAVARAKRGDDDGIRYLYVRYSTNVCQYVRSIVGDEYEAEDITQHVFGKLPRAIRTYEERAVPFAAWILRVARNAALDHLRSRRPVPCEEVRGAEDDSVEDGYEQLSTITDALDALPEEQRKVLVMRHVVGLSPGEIAGRLGKTEGSIHGLHHRGRRTLREELVERGAAPAVAG
jgi:RNA polymerase sigma-70 factor (ECF subfamily)